MGLVETQVGRMNGAGAEAVPALVFREVSFAYGEEAPLVLASVNLDLWAGRIVALMGPNGSGKSTLARLANGVLSPSAGRVLVGGLCTGDREAVWSIRSKVGLVMQDPDQQIVGATVEEDAAFGLENQRVPHEQMRERVEAMLRRLGLAEEAHTEVHQLSGGQKQRLALAGVLLLRPAVLVLDEPTSMLDPQGRAELLQLIREERARGVAVLLITQRADEAVGADRVVALARGSIAYDGEPREFFRSPLASRLGLGLPSAMQLAAELPLAHWGVGGGKRSFGGKEQAGADHTYRDRPGSDLMGSDPFDEEELLTLLGRVQAEGLASSRAHRRVRRVRTRRWAAAARLSGVSLAYSVGAGLPRQALSELDLEIPSGAVTALVGETASGKSSILHVLGGVRTPGSGRLEVLGQAVERGEGYPRGLVGLALQRPESSLYAATVEDDVGAAPRFQGLSGPVLDERVVAALEAVGLDAAVFAQRSPFVLSVGEQRRVALAGVIALEPRLLLLDEPAAGLDAAGRRALLSSLACRFGGTRRIGGRAGEDAGDADRESGDGRTLVFSTHDTEEAAWYADYVAVVAHGRVVVFGEAAEVLSNVTLLEGYGLVAPLAARIAARLGAEPAHRVFESGSLSSWLSTSARSSSGGRRKGTAGSASSLGGRGPEEPSR